MPHARKDLARLLEIARRQGGVVSKEDLRACGISSDAALRQVRKGAWQKVGSAWILSAPGTRLSPEGQAWCLQVAYGPRARVSGSLALKHGGWDLPDETLIVVVPDRPHRSPLGAVTIRRTDYTTAQSHAAPRYEPVEVAFLDTLVVVGPRRAAAIADVALQKRLVTPCEFEKWIQPRLGRGNRGAASLREILERMASGSRSEAEQRMAPLLARSRTGPWVPNLSVLDSDGRVVAEIDFALEGLKIAIEVDGRAHHSDRRSFERDRERQNMLVLRGWLVLRFTWEQITQQPEMVIAAVRAAVHHRSLGGNVHRVG